MNNTEKFVKDWTPIPQEEKLKEETSGSPLTYWQDVRRRFVQNKVAVVSLFIIVILVLLSVFGPMMTGKDYYSQDLVLRKVAPILTVYEAADGTNLYVHPDVRLFVVDEDGYIGEDGRDYTLPRFKVREDHFVRGFYAYMGYDFDSEDDDVVLGLTDIVGALMEDSWATFEPDVIRVTTSNQTIKDFFRVDELIGTVSAQIGFKQRVFNIDELESSFAMYTVGDLEDIEGESVYSVKLHETIPVIFDFGNSITVKDMFFLYDEESIAVVNEQQYYMPATKNLFMGVSRDYNVEITTEQGRLAIDNLRLVGSGGENLYEWEPLEPVPECVGARTFRRFCRYRSSVTCSGETV